MKTKAIFLLFAVSGFNTCLLQAQEADLAKQLIDNERYQSAETLLVKATATEPSDAELSNLLVKTYLEQDKMAAAKTYVEDHLQAALNDAAAPLQRVAYARYLLGTGNKAAADKIVSSLLSSKKNLKDPQLLISLAEAFIDEDAGDVRLAITWLDMAEKRDKKNPLIDLLKGQAYRKLPDASSAFTAYQDALKKDPENVKAHYLIGKIFTAQKNPDVYLEHFLKAYQLDSTYAPVLEELYRYYYYRDIKQAKKFLEKYIASSDYSLQNDYYMTDILYLNGEYEQAIKAASVIIQKEADKSQPRLYKLMAYAAAKTGDSAQALVYINDYFNREDPLKFIAADFELRAQLTERDTAAVLATIGYYSIAAEMDTVLANKAKYAARIAALYKQEDDFSNEAVWLGKLYRWKESSNNIDLFNWGLAHYTAKEYSKTDSVFGLYTSRYPEDIYGYYWRAQASAAIDTSMIDALAIPHYLKVVEIGEKNKETNKKMLLKAYGYLGGYEANITKDYPASLTWFEKYLGMDPANEDVIKYTGILQKWIADNKK